MPTAIPASRRDRIRLANRTAVTVGGAGRCARAQGAAGRRDRSRDERRGPRHPAAARTGLRGALGVKSCRPRAEQKPAACFARHVQPLLKKYFYFRISEDMVYCRHLAPTRGTFGQSSRHVGRDAMDAKVRRRCVSEADGQVVWSWSPDAGIKRMDCDFGLAAETRDPFATEANKPGTPARARSKP